MSWDQISDYADAFIADDFDRRDMSYLNVDLNKFNETAKQINSHDFKMYDNTSKISQITVSPIMNQILTYMRIQMDGKLGPKFVLLSAHDTNIVVTLNFLKKALNLEKLIFTNIVFASNIIIELNVDDNNTYSINIVHNDVLIYNNSIDKFNSSIAKFTVSEKEINSFCYFPEGGSDPNNIIYYIILSCLSLVIIGLVIFLIKILNRNTVCKKTDGSLETIV